MDFKDYLLNELYRIANDELELDVKLNVAEFRSFEMPEDKSELLFVIRYITGSYVGNVKTQPLQIFCYSQLNDISTAYLILDAFSKKHNNFQITVDGSFVKMNFETPVSMRNFIQSEEGYRASVYEFGTYIECEDAIDFKEIKLKISDSESFEIPFISASVAYSAVLNTTKISGVQLSKSIKQEAGLSMSMSIMNANNVFCNDIRDIMFNNATGNKDFTFIFVNPDDSTYEITMKLETCTRPTDKSTAPMLQLTFRG